MTNPQSGAGKIEVPESRGLVIASLIVILLVFVGCFWPFVLGEQFLYGDLGNWHLPVRIFYADRLELGESPLWLPNLFCGFYLHGEGQAGLFHPVHWLLYRYLPLDFAFGLECALAYPIAFVGMVLFLRRLPVPMLAAICGGAAFGFSTYLLVRYMHVNVVTVLAHVPWLLWCASISASASRPRERWLAWIGIALLTASQILLGYPGAVVFSIAALGLYALFLCCEQSSLRTLAVCVTATIAGLLIGSVQLVPTFEHYSLSVRTDTLVGMRLAQSLHPWNLLQMLSPYLFAQRVYQLEVPNSIEQSFYLGATLPIAVTWMLARWRRFSDSRSLVTCLAVLCAVSLLFAMGRYTGVHDFFVALPLFGQLRVPARFTFFFHLAGAIVLALAFADLLSSAHDPARRRAERLVWIVPAVSIAIAGIALAVVPAPATVRELGQSLSPVLWVLLGPALSLVAAALWVAAARGIRFAIVGLVLFVAADQASYGALLMWSVPPQSVTDFVASVPRVPEPVTGRVAMGFSDRIFPQPNGDITFYAASRHMLHDTKLVSGYAGLMPTKVLPPYSPKNLEIAGAAYVYIVEQGQFVLQTDPLPRYRLVSQAETAQDLPRQLDGIDVRLIAVVGAAVDLSPGRPGTVIVRKERPGDIRLSIDAPSRQLLVISESFHPGWVIEVDGEPSPVVRVYGDFMGTPIDPGVHEVELRFAPKSLTTGLSLSVLGLVLVAGAGVMAWRDGQRIRFGSPPSE